MFLRRNCHKRYVTLTPGTPMKLPDPPIPTHPTATSPTRIASQDRPNPPPHRHTHTHTINRNPRRNVPQSSKITDHKCQKHFFGYKNYVKYIWGYLLSTYAKFFGKAKVSYPASRILNRHLPAQSQQ